MQNVKRIFFTLCLVFYVGCLAAQAEPQTSSSLSPKGERSAKPITIKADELKADNKGKTAIFTGRVVARQGDVTIYSDKLIIHYGEHEEQVDKIEAIGSVRILQTNRVGTGGHAVYENRPGKVTLSINPKVVQGSDSITGKVIVYYLDEERSVVKGGENARVEAVIHPKSGGLAKKRDEKKQP